MEEVDVFRVSTRVNSPANEGAEIIEPVEDDARDEGVQGELF
jgi:putative SOS response-associated peptidase YedK